MGSWFLVDSTWGAGHINSGDVYQRGFNQYYFLTPPSQLIFTHFPVESKWQLLKQPLSKEEFIQQPELDSAFFSAGIELVSPKHGNLDSRYPVRITLHVPDETSVEAVGNGAAVTRNGHLVYIDAPASSSGKYNVELFVGSGGYLIHCARFQVD